MTDKEIIRKEIERLMAEEMEIYKSANKDGDGDASAAPVVYTRLQMIISFIDSMKEELDTARTVCDEYCAICPHNTCKIKMRREEEPVHRTQEDLEAAMADVEEKSKAFTEAHQGETAIPDIVDEHYREMLGEELIRRR